MKTNAHTKLGNHGSPNPSSKGNRTHENTSNDNELDLTTCLHRLVRRRFILHHQNNPAALSGHTCARGSAHPTYYCRVDTMNRQLDCPRPRKGSCLLQYHW